MIWEGLSVVVPFIVVLFILILLILVLVLDLRSSPLLHPPHKSVRMESLEKLLFGSTASRRTSTER